MKKNSKNHEQIIFGESLLFLFPHIPQLRKSNIGNQKEDQCKQSQIHRKHDPIRIVKDKC